MGMVIYIFNTVTNFNMQGNSMQPETFLLLAMEPGLAEKRFCKIDRVNHYWTHII
jgi:hypothetical protein